MATGVALALLLTIAPAARTMTARPDGSVARGLDVSAYQHLKRAINWRLLARDGIAFVAIKASEGTYYANPYYRSDAAAAARAGLAVLPYVFANPGRDGGKATARFAVRVTGSRRGRARLPLVVDLENDPYAPRNCYRQGARRMVAWVAGFVREAWRLTGKRPVIYTTDAWWRQCTRSSGRFHSDPLWLASYGVRHPAVPAPWHRWAFWQYSGGGFLPGVGRTDLDYFRPVAAFASLHPAKHRKSRRPRRRKR